MFVVVVILAILLAGVRLVGLAPYTVLSGSMEPHYHVGSLIYVKKVDPKTLAVGDDITYMISDTTVVTHRIIEILPDEDDPTILRFRTKGTANNTADGTPVHQRNILGKAVFTIPYLGYFANFVQNPPGLYIAIAFCVILVILVFLPDLIFGKEEEAKPKETTDTDPAEHPEEPEESKDPPQPEDKP
ncbi:MAG: signal peptidase I [Clostridia bacterium]|nr:signal peptidase I [Clostridia bacterium]